MGINEEKNINAINEDELENISGGLADWRLEQSRAITTSKEERAGARRLSTAQNNNMKVHENHSKISSKRPFI